MLERPFLVLAAVATAALVAASADPQGGMPYSKDCYYQRGPLAMIKNSPYDGRFAFFRVSFEPLGGGGGFRRFVDRKWDHDTPRADQHFMKILREITTLEPQMLCPEIAGFGDPESFKYPIAYVSEPGFWSMNEQELTGVRDYVHKGGFIIFDDFVGEHWYNFEEKWRQAFPDLELVELDESNAIFDSFYHIGSLKGFTHPYFGNPQSHFFGAFEDNDPKKRLVTIANYNSDLGDYMEFSDEAFLPIALSNEAYKLMVNYVVYGMTH